MSENNFKQRGKIQILLTISSTHVGDSTRELLDSESQTNSLGLSVYTKDADGWYIYSFKQIPDEIKEKIPASLLDCIQYAKEVGADVLCLDCYGPVVHDLEIYN